ncbi:MULTISPECIES: sugar ABC transporter ATP-binding protein [Aeromicrobium]|uniref:Sugar ABC transporter ATP-binding protein n=1 Tax=Aeromicrobium phoceense TaxID=2754045 RepID=A0A838XKX8_9ACTN|nr:MULTISPECIES: sugar ABC transporter ATP-binding protein [Aeromicrobium]MBA4607623.1 sugar ABC transporter ATP-binding protein [Aeromicrobium phoceense]
MTIRPELDVPAQGDEEKTMTGSPAGGGPDPAPVTSGLLQMRGISKSFGGSRALDGVSIEVRPGSVHALCGANGAGKSTLVKILAGLERADEGEILLDGERVEVANPRDAADLGLSFIHQELNLVPKFSVLRNMAMGSGHPGRFGILDLRRLRREAKAVQERLGFEIPLDIEVEQLSVSDRWMVSLGRSLMRDARFIAMDEPTASFTDEEASKLMSVIDELTSDGVGILYVSHRLDEVLQVSDTITVFRNGQKVATLDSAETDRQELTTQIVGREVEKLVSRLEAEADESVAETRPVRLGVRGLSRAPRVLGASFDVHEGEIVGIAGLVGAGRTELARLLIGADRATGGTMTLGGEPYAPKSPHDALRAGIALVPEERRSQGLVLTDTVENNLAMAEHGSASSMRARFRPKSSRSTGEALMERFSVKARSIRDTAHHLSGGNQQKVVVGKYVRTNPGLLVLDEPTVGVDVGARAEIYRIITGLASEGTSVLVISSDFEELAICDRVLVMRAGQLVAEVPASEFDEDHLTALCFGSSESSGTTETEKPA